MNDDELTEWLHAAFTLTHPYRHFAVIETYHCHRRRTHVRINAAQDDDTMTNSKALLS